MIFYSCEKDKEFSIITHEHLRDIFSCFVSNFDVNTCGNIFFLWIIFFERAHQFLCVL